MLLVVGAFLFILATHLPGLLKAQLKTIIAFGAIWTFGLGLSYLTLKGVTLPIAPILNSIFNFFDGIFFG